MAPLSPLISEDIEAYLQLHEQKDMLRFITCGSVDDGKSSLIGRLLFESRVLFADQLAQLEHDSKKVGTRGGALDYALLLDGLSAEREQGITIDVAYRFFSTDRRKFIVADTPGHEQYTRNMVTGASTAELAIILVDARKGLLTQTRRHSTVVGLMGIRHLVLAVNKMDLVDYSETVFRSIESQYLAFAKTLGLADVLAIPLSAVEGDNVVEAMGNTPWYLGPALMTHLETVELDASHAERGGFRFPVQWVNRPTLDFRGFTGTVVGGRIAVGDPVLALPSGKSSRVKEIIRFEASVPSAGAEEAITLTLEDEIDVSRGDVLAGPDDLPETGSSFEAILVWMDEAPLAEDRLYLVKVGPKTVPARIKKVRHRLDIDSQMTVPAGALHLNEIGLVLIELDREIAFDRYEENRDTGGFILIDRISNNTIAAGMIQRKTNVNEQNTATTEWVLDRAVAGLRAARDQWRTRHQRQLDEGGREFPSREALTEVVRGLAAALFPMRLGPSSLRKEAEDQFVEQTLSRSLSHLKEQILLELSGRMPFLSAQEQTVLQARAHGIVQSFLEELPEIRRLIDLDVEAAYRGDPAASSVDEILLCYPGVLAILHYRIAHPLSLAGLPLIARVIAEIAHSDTGVDIHPAARIDESFFIDHGTGVVIGGTARIGKNVRIYQAVTLGAKRLDTEEGGLVDRHAPRHPEVEDDVIIYAGATILGHVTIGRGSVIGGNVWLTHSVPPHSQITQASLNKP